MMKIAIAVLFSVAGCLATNPVEDRVTIDTIPGNNNDLFVGDGDNTTVVLHVLDGFPILTGISHGYDGRLITIRTTYDSALIALTCYDGSSESDNQLVVDYSPGVAYRKLHPEESIGLRYDAEVNKWFER